MSKNFQERSAPGTAAADDVPPPLPEHPYRMRIRGVLQKYRHLHDVGWDHIIKNGMLPLLSSAQIAAFESVFDLRTMRRRLIRFCDEDNGDLKEPRTFSLAETFLERSAPELMAQIVTQRNLLRTGRSFSAFLTVPVEARLHHMTAEAPQITPLYKSGIAPGVYVLWDHQFAAPAKRPQRFLVLHDVGDNDFLVGQTLTVSWRSPKSTELTLMHRYSGFLFPFAINAALVLRSVPTNRNDICAAFVMADQLPEALRQQPGYVCSLAAGGLMIAPARRLRDHVFKDNRLGASGHAIAQLAEHRLWDL